MKIGLRIFLGYFLIVALAALLLAQVFVAQVKPGVRQTMEDTLVDTANVLAELATDDLMAGRIADGRFAQRVRAMHARDPGAAIWGFPKRATNYRVYVTDARGVVVFDSGGPGGSRCDGDARRGADPRRRRPHRRLADRREAQRRDRAVHRAQPGDGAEVGRGAARRRAARRHRRGGMAVAPAQRAAAL